MGDVEKPAQPAHYLIIQYKGRAKKQHRARASAASRDLGGRASEVKDEREREE